MAETKLRALDLETKDTVAHGPTIKSCIAKFLEGHMDNIGPETLEHYTRTLGRFETFAEGRNKFFIREVDVDLLEDFKIRGFPTMRSTTKSTAMGKLVCFLKEAYRRGWTTEALAQKVKPVKAVYEQKLPFTDAEVELILNQAEKMEVGEGGYAAQPKTFQLLLKLMLETGLRVSDAIRYDPRRCKKSKHFWIYTFEVQKRRKGDKPKVSHVYLTEELKTAIDDAVWLSERYPFAYRAFVGHPQEIKVYNRMQIIGKACGVENCRPHRLRDTFAVRTLLKGMALEDVSKLLGHATISVTEKFYAAWVPARQDRLEGLLSKALVDTGSD